VVLDRAIALEWVVLTLGFDTLSGGISFSCCSAMERAYLRLKDVDDAGR
jgi:hypothetical protein